MDNSSLLKRKKQITNAAQTLFRKKGYAASSMRDLAAAIQVEPASLYNHIKSKEDILSIICFNVSDDFFKAIKPIHDSSLPPLEKLQKAIVAHVNVIKNNADGFAVFVNDWRYLKGYHFIKYKKLRKQYEQYYRDMLIEGVETGLYKNLDIKLTILTIFSSLNWIYHWFKPSGAIAPEKIGEHLSDLITNGLIA